jgi:predicted metallopeptidase
MGREYKHSDEIEAIAKKLVPEHHPHLQHAAIAYLMRTLDPDKKLKLPVKRAGKKSKVAKAIGVPELWHAICGFDFVMSVDELFWAFMSADCKEAVVDHELCHFAHDEDGWYIRDHDIQEFTAILKRHGFYMPELKEFCAAAPVQKDLPYEPKKEKKSSEARVQ